MFLVSGESLRRYESLPEALPYLQIQGIFKLKPLRVKDFGSNAKSLTILVPNSF